MSRRNISQVERSAILEAWGRKCSYCDKKGVSFEVEHIIPKSKGGSCLLENLCISCVPCNRKKKATLLPKMYEGILLGMAQRKAKRVRRLVDKHNGNTPVKAEKARTNLKACGGNTLLALKMRHLEEKKADLKERIKKAEEREQSANTRIDLLQDVFLQITGYRKGLIL